MRNEMISPSSSAQKHILQQGYLQQFKDESCFKVFVIVKDSELLLYRDDPANNPRTTLFSSINLAKAQVLEEGDYRRPKSFGLFIDQQYFEFSCPTNSVKASWLRALTQSRNSPALEGLRKLQSNMELFRSPVPRTQQRQQQQQAPQQQPQYESSYFGDAMQQLKLLTSSSTSGMMMEQQLSPAAAQQQTSSSLFLKPMMKKAATLTSRRTPTAAATAVQEKDSKDAPRWVPSNYGNKAHSSRLMAASAPLSPRQQLQSPRAQFTSPQRVHNANIIQERQAYDQQQQQQLQQDMMYRASSAPSSRSAAATPQVPNIMGNGSSLEHVTIGQIREALMSMPLPLRSSLLGTTSPVVLPQQLQPATQHHGIYRSASLPTSNDYRQRAGGGRGGEEGAATRERRRSSPSTERYNNYAYQEQQEQALDSTYESNSSYRPISVKQHRRSSSPRHRGRSVSPEFNTYHQKHKRSQHRSKQIYSESEYEVEEEEQGLYGYLTATDISSPERYIPVRGRDNIATVATVKRTRSTSPSPVKARGGRGGGGGDGYDDHEGYRHYQKSSGYGQPQSQSQQSGGRKATPQRQQVQQERVSLSPQQRRPSRYRQSKQQQPQSQSQQQKGRPRSKSLPSSAFFNNTNNSNDYRAHSTREDLLSWSRQQAKQRQQGNTRSSNTGGRTPPAQMGPLTRQRSDGDIIVKSSNRRASTRNNNSKQQQRLALSRDSSMDRSGAAAVEQVVRRSSSSRSTTPNNFFDFKRASKTTAALLPTATTTAAVAAASSPGYPAVAQVAAKRPSLLITTTAAANADSNGDGHEEVTDLAEWQRFVSFLASFGLAHYADSLRNQGVSQLSVLELVTQEHLVEMGVSIVDAGVILHKAKELTQRLQSFSELGSGNDLLVNLSPQRSSSFRGTALAAAGVGSGVAGAAVASPALNGHELKLKLLGAYESGDQERFFSYWSTLPASPPFTITDDNSSQEMKISTKQTIEFHLYLYFCVTAMRRQMPPLTIVRAKTALRKFLDRLAALEDNNNRVVTTSTALNKASSMSSMQLSPQQQEKALDLETLTTTKEFAMFAGLVFVPYPQLNPAFQQLFRDDWTAALKMRLGQYLEVLLPSPPVKQQQQPRTGTEQQRMAVEEKDAEEGSDVDEEVQAVKGDGNDDQLILAAPPTPPPPLLKPAPIRVTATASPAVSSAVKGGKSCTEGGGVMTMMDLSSPDLSPIQPVNPQLQPNTDVIRIKPVTTSSKPVPLPVTTQNISQLNNTTNASKGATPTAVQAAEQQCLSPKSDTSSISQLTDDTPLKAAHNSNHPPPVAGNHFMGSSIKRPMPPPQQSAIARAKASVTTSKSSLQAQVDNYNKLLKMNRAKSAGSFTFAAATAAAVTTDPAAVAGEEPMQEKKTQETGNTQQQQQQLSPTTAKMQQTKSLLLQPKASFGATQAIGVPTNSLEAQVNRYKVLLRSQQRSSSVSNNVAAAVHAEVVAASVGGAPRSSASSAAPPPPPPPTDEQAAVVVVDPSSKQQPVEAGEQPTARDESGTAAAAKVEWWK